MNTTKEILDEISAEPGTNAKMDILKKYKDNELLKSVLYQGMSKRVKFYIKQIPEFQYVGDDRGLEWAISELNRLSKREFTGGAAINHLQCILGGVNPSDQYVVIRIIEKDFKIGLGRTNVNKVIPKLIEETYYMGAIPFDDKKVKNIFTGGAQGISEVKADGRYCNAVIIGGDIELVSRQGENTTLVVGKLVDELSKFEDCVLNGELVIDGIKREISNGIITSVIDITEKMMSDDIKDQAKAEKSKESMFKKHRVNYDEILDRIRFIVWDILDIDDYFTNKSGIKRIDRLNRLIETVNKTSPEMISVVEHKFVDSYDEALSHFAEILSRGEEGTILKSFDGIWKHGKHNYQIKMKVEFDLDLKIVGFNYGNEGTKNENVISSVTCESSCGKLSTRAQGIPEDLMEYITENQDSLMGTIITVKCNGLSSNREGGNSVLYPTLKELRNDKIEADSFEDCVKIDSAAKGLKNII